MYYNSIIDAGILCDHLDDPQWLIVDCRFDLGNPEGGKLDYINSHIPNAIYAHLDDDLSSDISISSGRHPLPDINKLKSRFSMWGISNDTQVVVYDDSGGSIAARLWWLLRWLNHDKVALLNGGLAGWSGSSMPLSNSIKKTSQIDFKNTIRQQFWVNSEFVEQIRKDKNYRLLDVRAPERFQGLVEPIDKIAGHIPGAINMPWQGNLDDNGFFKSADVLKSEFQKVLDCEDASNTVVMCGSGVTACHTLVALEHAGLVGAKLYPGSWSEWITNSNRPVSPSPDNTK